VQGLQELFGLPSASVTPHAELEADLQLDSLATAELAVWLEDALAVRLPADAGQPRTLGDLQALLDAARAEQDVCAVDDPEAP